MAERLFPGRRTTGHGTGVCRIVWQAVRRVPIPLAVAALQLHLATTKPQHGVYGYQAHRAGLPRDRPDQIGFCTASKPENYQYTFQQLATDTRPLLQSINVDRAIIIGHSTGGMLATRYALMYPEQTEKRVMVNPIGLEDWKAKGAPYRTVDQWYPRELKLSVQGVKKYELTTYYVGGRKPEYDKWVDMLAGLNSGPGHEKVAWNSALIYDMIFTQPIYYELPDLRVPTTLIIGTADTTAIDSDIAPPKVKARLGHYQVLGKEAAKRIPGAKLIEFPSQGHAPQMKEPDRFHLDNLKE